MKYCSGCLKTILLNSSSFGQAKDASASATESSRMEELRRSGLEALYNLDYEKSRKDFSEIAGSIQIIPPAHSCWLPDSGQGRFMSLVVLQASLYSQSRSTPK